MSKTPPAANGNRFSPFRFVVAFGVVSLFADFTYEGARSVVGPFLATLGASAGLVGFVTGAGEAVAIVLRLFTGPIADRTRRYWGMSIWGYVINVVSVPLLATAHSVGLGSTFVITERFGKAIRVPARDTLISHAGSKIGQGWAFAVHEALDQTGAFIGPLVVALVLWLGGGFRTSFLVLIIPAVFATVCILGLRAAVPNPENYEERVETVTESTTPRLKLSREFWLYTLFTAITMLGFSTFAVLSYHLQVRHVVASAVIPIMYAVAMGIGALVALISGRIYDRFGLLGLSYLPILAGIVPFLSFTKNVALVWIGALVWGIALGIHESTMRGAVANLSPLGRRATAFGIFNAAYGIAWLIGSGVTGVLYSTSVADLQIFVVVVEVVAVVSFIPVAMFEFKHRIA